jgi:hypothetical protein
VPLETHHIVFQKDAVNNIINGYQHKNTSSNLVVICQKCHDEVDRGNINIVGKIETSKGEELIIKEKDELIINDELTEVEKKVIELSKKKMNQKMIKEKLSQENINLSVSKIGKIIANYI